MTGATVLTGVEIRMQGDALGSDVWFDPVGVLIEPGQTVRWVVAENVHTTTAYHPKNETAALAAAITRAAM